MTLKPLPSRPIQALYSRKASAFQRSSSLETETQAKSARLKRTMRTALLRVTHSSPQQETRVQLSAPAPPWGTSPALTCTTRPSLELRDCPTMQLEPSRRALLPRLSRVLRDYLLTMVHASLDDRSLRTVYLMGMVGSRYGMSPASVSRPVERRAYFSA